MPVADAFDVWLVLLFLAVTVTGFNLFLFAVMRYWNEESARNQRKRALTKALSSPIIPKDSPRSVL
jgi:hypothetical protein